MPSFNLLNLRQLDWKLVGSKVITMGLLGFWLGTMDTFSFKLVNLRQPDWKLVGVLLGKTTLLSSLVLMLECKLLWFLSIFSSPAFIPFGLFALVSYSIFSDLQRANSKLRRELGTLGQEKDGLWCKLEVEKKRVVDLEDQLLAVKNASEKQVKAVGKERDSFGSKLEAMEKQFGEIKAKCDDLHLVAIAAIRGKLAIEAKLEAIIQIDAVIKQEMCELYRQNLAREARLEERDARLKVIAQLAAERDVCVTRCMTPSQ